MQEGSPAEVVEQLILYVEAALALARQAREPAAIDRLMAIHARLVRDGLSAVSEDALFS
jgi:hypothetical protein